MQSIAGRNQEAQQRQNMVNQTTSMAESVAKKDGIKATADSFARARKGFPGNPPMDTISARDHSRKMGGMKYYSTLTNEMGSASYTADRKYDAVKEARKNKKGQDDRPTRKELKSAKKDAKAIGKEYEKVYNESLQ